MEAKSGQEAEKELRVGVCVGRRGFWDRKTFGGLEGSGW